MDKVIATTFVYGAVVLIGFSVGFLLGTQVHPDGKRSVLVGNGDIYEGNWVKGKFTGDGLLIKPSGQIMRGEWIERITFISKQAFSTNIADHAKVVLTLPVMIGISGVYQDMRSYAAVSGMEKITITNYPNLLANTFTKESVTVHTVIVDSSAQSFAFTEDPTSIEIDWRFNPF